MQTKTKLWQQLKNAGLVQGAEPAELEQPLYLQIFYAVMTWIAAQSFIFALLLFFLLIFFIAIDNQTMANMLLVPASVVFIGMAALISWRSKHFFLTQLVVTFALGEQTIKLLPDNKPFSGSIIISRDADNVAQLVALDQGQKLV